MAGRKPKLNWAPCFNQFTCTIVGEFHRLGKDKATAEREFKHLLRQAELGQQPEPNITFADLADRYLDYVQEKRLMGRSCGRIGASP
jgi:hypothetical protein